MLDRNGFEPSAGVDSAALADAVVELIEPTVDEAASAERLPHVVPRG